MTAPINPEIVERAKEMRRGGSSYAAIGKILDVCPDTIMKYTQDEPRPEAHLKSPGKYKYNTQLFDEPNAITYYLLGAFITDGNVSQNRISSGITSKDYDWLVSMRDIICPGKPIFHRKTANAYDLKVDNTYIVNWLINHCCVPNKSLTVQFPDVPDEYLSCFIRGVFDGDGCISIVNATGAKTTRLSIAIGGGSKDFIGETVARLNKAGITTYFHTQQMHNMSIMGGPRKDYHDYYQAKIAAGSNIPFCEFIYQTDGIRLQRKFDTYQKYLDIRKCELLTNPNTKKPLQDPNHVVELLKTHTYKEVGTMYNLDPSNIIRQLQKLGLHQPRRKPKEPDK